MPKYFLSFLSKLSIVSTLQILLADSIRGNEPQKLCQLPSGLEKEIQSYQKIANTIIDAVKDGAFKGKTYKDVETFVDQFERRSAGSASLEKSIDYLVDFLKKDGIQVETEKVENVHVWSRGKEKASIIKPFKRPLKILGLGWNVGTEGRLKAPVLVVRSFEELQQKAELAAGKIIVYNQDFQSYFETSKYRKHGAVEAAKVGGVAALIKSITSFSMNSPHTGIMRYNETVKEIPATSLSVEDAEYLDRLQSRGQPIVICLRMDDKNLPNAESRNVIASIRGREKPDEVVLVSGHIDSWDISPGALDDAAGVFVSMEILLLLKSLNLIPRRSIRGVAFTTEETDTTGSATYLRNHKEELDKHSAVLESDYGTFRPRGLEFSGSSEAGCIVQHIAQLLRGINAAEFTTNPFVGQDIDSMVKLGVPGINLLTNQEKYFWFHHTEADTMAVLNSTELDLCTAVWAVTTYVLADLTRPLPRQAGPVQKS